MENAWSGFNRAWSDHWIAVSTLPVFNAHAFIWIDTVQSLYLSVKKTSSYQLLHSNYILHINIHFIFQIKHLQKLIFFVSSERYTNCSQNRKSLIWWAFLFQKLKHAVNLSIRNVFLIKFRFSCYTKHRGERKAVAMLWAETAKHLPPPLDEKIDLVHQLHAPAQ